jgi:hypothetical protein
MSNNFLIYFKNLPPLEATIAESITGNNYYSFLKENYINQSPIFRDVAKYTVEYMSDLVAQAKHKLGWNWEYKPGDHKVAAQLHKDIEVLLEKGFESIPAEHDELVHEIHQCLHLLNEGRNYSAPRQDWLQIEWYNDNTLPIDDSFTFANMMNFGDLKLQYPFVGAGPLQIYMEKDYTKISQTCKFQTVIRPGINIVIDDFEYFTEHQKLLADIKKHDNNFYNLHGSETILRYTGYPVIGKVTNLDTLEYIIKQPTLEFEKLEFN